MRTASTAFQSNATDSTRDFDHRRWMQSALRNYETVRGNTQEQFRDWSAACAEAASIRREAIDNLPEMLENFTEKLEERGTCICWASDAKEATAYVIDVAQRRNAKSIIKSKSMTTEEIHLNDSLESAGYEVVESDLGEFIVQLRKETPFHIVFPAMHLRREAISDVFCEKLGSAPSDDPEELTMIARAALREKYCTADIGISGANFAIAETGMISITENEGNARLTTSLPPVHIAILGIEKVLPRLADLALFLPLLATAGAGQHLTGYNTMIGGPGQPGEPDGPEEFHVILLDNRRTNLLADPEQRDALRCIRCGACLNVCPVFKNIGGHTYNTTYPGPIGSVITPTLRGLQSWKHLSFASSLCGACSETCPVNIDLHRHLLRNRRRAAVEKPGFIEKTAFRGFAIMMKPGAYRFAGHLLRIFSPLRNLLSGTFLDPAKAWTRTRTLPPPAKKTFKDLWKEGGL